MWQDADLGIHGHGWRSSSSSRRCETKFALKESFSSVEAFFCEQTEHHICSSNDTILLPCSRSSELVYLLLKPVMQIVAVARYLLKKTCLSRGVARGCAH